MHWTITKTGDRYGSSALHPGQVLSVYNYRRQVPLRLQRRQRTKRQKLELFVEGLSCNFAEITAYSPFMSMFLAQIYDKWSTMT